MATKLKSTNRNKTAGIFLCTLILLLAATGVILTYRPVYRASEQLTQKLQDQRSQQIEQQRESDKQAFMTVLERGNYVLTMDLEQENDRDYRPSEIFLSETFLNLQEEDTWYQTKKDFIDSFNVILQQWYDDFFPHIVDQYPFFEYYIINQKTGEERSNSHIDRLLSDTEEAQEIKSEYPFYIIFQYDADGKLQIPDYTGFRKEKIDELLLRGRDMEIFEDGLNNLYLNQILKPANTTIIYASQSEEFYVSEGYQYSYVWNPIRNFGKAGFGNILGITAVIVALLAVLLPLNKNWGIGQGPASRIPLEPVVLGILSGAFLYEGLSSMAYETVSGYFLMDPDQTIFSASMLHSMDYIFNFLVWILVYGAIFAAALSLRQIVILKPGRYLRERTITGAFLRYCVKLMKKLYTSLSNIDLTDKSNRIIFKIVIVNFLILVLLCSIWFFGIAILIPYSIILYFILKRYSDDIKRNYAILLGATSKMADGNLEVEIEENVGVFNPLKGELLKVQHGFKKAVEEEMKSQRMRTDLITNVSHDLKTPLTAIITYINLLKDENITEEERRSYINTLDQKSQRLKHLIEDLFEMSKASSDNVTLNYEQIDLGNLIKQVALELADKLEQARVELKMHLPEEKVVLSLDSEKTYRIFENLMVNITKYALPHSRAYIDLEAAEDKVVVVLKNISEQELTFDTQEITERFVRGDLSRNTEGSGLGLAIVKSFVELQDGSFKIRVDGDLFKAVIVWNREKHPG